MAPEGRAARLSVTSMAKAHACHMYGVQRQLQITVGEPVRCIEYGC
jgi:hypothetical protein